MMAVFASTLMASLRFGSTRTLSAIIGKDPIRLNNCAGANDLHPFDFVLGPALAHRRHYDDRARDHRARDLPVVHPPADPAGGPVQPVPSEVAGARSGPGQLDSRHRRLGYRAGRRKLPVGRDGRDRPRAAGGVCARARLGRGDRARHRRRDLPAPVPHRQRGQPARPQACHADADLAAGRQNLVGDFHGRRGPDDLRFGPAVWRQPLRLGRGGGPDPRSRRTTGAEQPARRDPDRDDPADPRRGPGGRRGRNRLDRDDHQHLCRRSAVGSAADGRAVELFHRKAVPELDLRGRRADRRGPPPCRLHGVGGPPAAKARRNRPRKPVMGRQSGEVGGYRRAIRRGRIARPGQRTQCRLRPGTCAARCGKS